MQANTVLSLVTDSSRHIRKPASTKEVMRFLRAVGLRPREGRIYKLRREDFKPGVVVVIPRKHGGVLVTIPATNLMPLLGKGERATSLPVPFSVLSGLGKACDKAFEERIFDFFSISYMREEIGVIMSASQLMERLR